MKKYVLLMMVIPGFCRVVPAQPCTDYSCDSLAVRAILDTNGFTGVAVESVTQTGTNGRIENLRLVADPGYQATLPAKMTVLPDRIGQLTALKKLYLGYNSITSIPDSMGRLASLTEAYFYMNSISLVPEALGGLVNLTTLDLGGNPLSSLPDTLASLNQLMFLVLTGCQFSVFPEVMGRLPALRRLYLSSNRLTAIPDACGNLVHITDAYLNGNQITDISDSIVNCTALTSLDLSANYLTALPDAIGILPNLRGLNVTGNQLTALPVSLCSRTEMQSLEISYNRLTTLPDSIVNLTGLLSLGLAHNYLCSLSPEVEAWADTYDPDWRDTQQCSLRVAYGIPRNRAQVSYLQVSSRPTEPVLVSYRLPVSTRVLVQAYDVNGTRLQTLVNGPATAGSHRVSWKPDRRPSGICLFTLQTSDPSGSVTIRWLNVK